MIDILRYLGVRRAGPELLNCAFECEKEAESLSPRRVCAIFDFELRPDGIILAGSGIALRGRLARRVLGSSEKIVVMLATLGLESEAMLERATASGALKGMVMHATLTAAIEKYLDSAMDDFRESGRMTTKRISCGYGDFPLETQKTLFDAVRGDGIGVKINECGMLIPNKSVICAFGAS